MDIDQFLEYARNAILTDGRVMPTIYLELAQTVNFILLDIINDSQSIPTQCGILARYAWEFCKKHPGETPVRIGFFSEGWMSDSAKNPLMPVNSHKKREVLVVEMWQANHEEQSYIMQIVRDHKKRVQSVHTPLSPKREISYQLASFVKGALDAQRPDTQVFDQLHKIVENGVQGLSPEKKRILANFLRQEGLQPPDFLEKWFPHFSCRSSY